MGKGREERERERKRDHVKTNDSKASLKTLLKETVNQETTQGA